MDDLTGIAADEKIRSVIEDYIEKYSEEQKISCDDDFMVEFFPIGESWTLHMISFQGEEIASVLHCGEQVIVTSYYRVKEAELFN